MIDDNVLFWDRRGILIGAGATGFVLSAGPVLARGDGAQLGLGLEYSTEEEPAPSGKVEIIPQSRYIRLSGNQIRMYGRNPNAVVNGFSRNMSKLLWQMGMADRRGSQRLVGTMRGIANTRQRRGFLRDQRDECRADLKSYSGSRAGYERKETMLKGVTYWSNRPREGLLKLNYKF